VFAGIVFDKFKRGKSIAINAILLLLAGASLSAGAIAHNAPLMLVGIVLIGISYGGAPSLTSSVTHALAQNTSPRISAQPISASFHRP
jgi:OFA family oxalate/formate antiporter-like MFS transporter